MGRIWGERLQTLDKSSTSNPSTAFQYLTCQESTEQKACKIRLFVLL
nr:MAG TPA: hypothetical protein [Caudoviricetes sp.]